MSINDIQRRVELKLIGARWIGKKSKRETICFCYNQLGSEMIRSVRAGCHLRSTRRIFYLVPGGGDDDGGGGGSDGGGGGGSVQALVFLLYDCCAFLTAWYSSRTA
jgi:hypothetical protein